MKFNRCCSLLGSAGSAVTSDAYGTARDDLRFFFTLADGIFFGAKLFRQGLVEFLKTVGDRGRRVRRGNAIGKRFAADTRNQQQNPPILGHVESNSVWFSYSNPNSRLKAWFRCPSE